MDPLTLEQVAADAAGTLVQGDPGALVHGVSTDSRTVEAGRLFIPLVGERFDGHSFIGEALARGARATLASTGKTWPDEVPPECGVIVVDDTLAALQRLASAQRRRLKAQVAAVTGSVGKTTTKDMLAAVGRTRARVVATKGNFNNEIGLPLTLLDADASTDLLVVEMGMRGPGEIRALAGLARPHVGVVTNVSAVHLERLGTLENIALAKRELIEALPPGGVAVLNGDDPSVRAMAHQAPGDVLFFGLAADNDVWATDVQGLGEHGSRFVLHYQGRSTAVELPVPGRHHVMNALAAAAAAFALGFDVDDAARGLAAADRRRAAMRTEVWTTPDGVRVINDAYNAGPASMAAALELLSEMHGERRVAVVGDMLELGALARQAHARVGRAVAGLGIDLLIAVGQWASVVAAEAVSAGMQAERTSVCRDGADAARLAARLVRPGDTVLIKASRGLRLEQVAETLARRRADDRQRKGEPAP